MKNGSDIERTQNTAVDIHNIGDYTYNMFTVFGRNILGINGSISRPFILHKLRMLTICVYRQDILTIF